LIQLNSNQTVKINVVLSTEKSKLNSTPNYKIFIIHTKADIGKRRASIEKQMSNHQLEYTFMFEGDKTDLDEKTLDKWLGGKIRTSGASADASCVIKHLLCIEETAKSNLSGALIFEDDALLADNFNAIFKQSLEEIKNVFAAENSAFLISYENSSFQFVSQSQTVKGQCLYKAPASRCAAAYYISKQACEMIISEIEQKKCESPIDWHFNTLADLGLLAIYWTHPPVVEQGSHNGSMQSLLDDKKFGILRRMNFAAQKFIKQHILRRLQ